MIDTITMRPQLEEWQKDMDLGMNRLGIYRMNVLRKELIGGMQQFVQLALNYEGLYAETLMPERNSDWWTGVRIKAKNSGLQFEAYAYYAVDPDNKLHAVINVTDRPTTEEFPIPEGRSWKLDKLYESEIKDPRYVIANIKNYFIQFESYRQIGRDVIYAPLEE